VGLGAYDVAVVISLFTFLTLWLLTPLKPDADDNAKPDGKEEPTQP
jgi:putative Mg2+ transporter-C (MgtC) family protein